MSELQTTKEADIRGWDAPGEHARATAYVTAKKAQAKERERLLNMLKGDPEAYKELWRRTVARTKSAPAYIEE